MAWDRQTDGQTGGRIAALRLRAESYQRESAFSGEATGFIMGVMKERRALKQLDVHMCRFRCTFGRPYVLSIGRAFGTLCRLSTVVCLSSVTFCIVAKRYVLAKNCLKERIGNHGRKVVFLGSPPYFYFRFRLYGHRYGRFYLIFARTAQRSVLDGTNGLSSGKPCAYCRNVCMVTNETGSSLATIIDPER